MDVMTNHNESNVYETRTSLATARTLDAFLPTANVFCISMTMSAKLSVGSKTGLGGRLVACAVEVDKPHNKVKNVKNVTMLFKILNILITSGAKFTPGCKKFIHSFSLDEFFAEPCPNPS